MHSKFVIAAFAAVFFLAGCVTLSGVYELKAYDMQGSPVASKMRLTAQGSGIYSARNGICIAHPGATVVITDLQTGKELAGESPYRCR